MTNKIVLLVTGLLLSATATFAKPKAHLHFEECGCIIDETASEYKCGKCGGFLEYVILSLKEYMDEFGRCTKVKYQCNVCKHFHIVNTDSYCNPKLNDKNETAKHTHSRECFSWKEAKGKDGYSKELFVNSCPAKKEIVFTVSYWRNNKIIKNTKIKLNGGESWADEVSSGTEVKVEVKNE